MTTAATSSSLNMTKAGDEPHVERGDFTAAEPLPRILEPLNDQVNPTRSAAEP